MSSVAIAIVDCVGIAPIQKGQQIGQEPLSCGEAIALPARSLARSFYMFPAGESPVALPCRFLSTPSIQLFRGPVSQLPVNLADGEPFVAGQMVGTKTYTLMFVGGHDGEAKLVGGGVQTVTSKPAWTPQHDGILLADTANKCLYVSFGGLWATVATSP